MRERGSYAVHLGGKGRDAETQVSYLLVGFDVQGFIGLLPGLKVTEPKAQALFETSAEVLGGLVKPFRDGEEATPANIIATSEPV